jgi:hypothetical protein
MAQPIGLFQKIIVQSNWALLYLFLHVYLRLIYEI